MYVLTVELVQMFARLKLSTQLNNTIYNKKYRLLSLEGSLFFHHRGRRGHRVLISAVSITARSS